MFNKKMGLLGLAAVGLLALAGCGGGGEGSDTTPTEESTEDTSWMIDPNASDLSICCPSDQTEFLNSVITKFKEDNPEYASKNISVAQNMGEGDVGDRLVADNTAVANVVLIADDNLRKAVNASALFALNTEQTAAVTTQSGAAAASAVTLPGLDSFGNSVDYAWGYPYRNDNGYVLIYDSAKISPEQAKSVEGILAACKAQNLAFAYPIHNSWYTPSFLWAAGGKMEPRVGTDGQPVIYSNFATAEVAKGAQAISDLFKQYGGEAIADHGFVSSDANGAIEDGFADGTVGACVIWNDLANIQKAVGTARANDIKATVLPTITIDGEAKSLYTFLGYKAIAINSNVFDPSNPTDRSRYDLAFDFAEYFASTKIQKHMLDTMGYGPCDLTLASDEKITSNQFLNALNLMNKDGHTVPQGVNVTDNFWTPVQNFGAYIRDHAKDTTGQWGEYDSALACIRAMITSQNGWAELTA